MNCSGEEPRKAATREPFALLAACAFILYVVLWAGCASQPHSNGTVPTVDSLTQRMTATEARHQLLDIIDRDIEKAKAHAADNAEVQILQRQRRQLTFGLQSLLAHSRKGDELWNYRTYSTTGQHGGTRGLVLMRNGKVVDYLQTFVVD